MVYNGTMSCNDPIKQALNDRLPFSWLSTRQVCQHWEGHFAVYPHGHKIRTVAEARAIVDAAGVVSLVKLVEIFADAPLEAEISGKLSK
jgi:hypothetical protein